MAAKIRVAHLSGPNATIQNTPPLVTSNKARRQHGLPLLADVTGEPARFDVLRPQKLAAAATLYVEQFSAHPLEADAADLYGPPDGYLDGEGRFAPERSSPDDRPVYRVEVGPDDGYYPLPYMARRADGRAWDGDGTSAAAPRTESRQPFMPDGSRLFEEIDRLAIGPDGLGNMVGNRAEVDFFRIAPPGGWMKGRDGAPPEIPGRDFFPYRPFHLGVSPSRPALARITNGVRRVLAGGYDGAIWTQGSPRVEETLYWFNLVLDTTVPVCGNASHRYHGQSGNDGPQNIVESVDYIATRVWADADGRNRAGVVMVEDQRIYAAREVMKVDARPGGYVATGGHGGILGGAGGRGGGATLRFLPATRHTWHSELRLTQLPSEALGIRGGPDSIVTVPVPVKDAAGELLEAAIPKISIVKDASYGDEDDDPIQHVDIDALLQQKLVRFPLSGFVLEGLSPYGKATATSRTRALMRAAMSGIPVVNVGRGNTEGFAWPGGPFIAGSNLTATKARMLLMACILKLGMLPPARDPAKPTREEVAAVERKVAAYQAIFDTH